MSLSSNRKKVIAFRYYYKHLKGLMHLKTAFMNCGEQGDIHFGPESLNRCVKGMERTGTKVKSMLAKW